jgi:alpha-tubulin suppressor-like RCC1 family protein
MIIKDLCNKEIIDLNLFYYTKQCYFSYKSKYCFAKDNNKNVYFINISKRKVKPFMNDEKIIDMCFGAHHSILLTQNGKVLEFSIDNFIFKPIDFRFKNYNYVDSNYEKVVMISCGGWHSLALTESGRVFGWGDNTFGQLGDDKEFFVSTPKTIELNGLKIKKTSCGLYHNLLLSTDGDIYAFGNNRSGEVGNGTQVKQISPIKVEHKDKFIDITSHSEQSISMSLSLKEEFITFGEILTKRMF